MADADNSNHSATYENEKIIVSSLLVHCRNLEALARKHTFENDTTTRAQTHRQHKEELSKAVGNLLAAIEHMDMHGLLIMEFVEHYCAQKTDELTALLHTNDTSA